MPDSVSSPLMNGEKLYSPAAAAKASRVPGHRGGPHLNGSTIFRHIVKGVRAANGEVIRLEAVRVGHRWLTSLEAIARFAERLTAAQITAEDSPEPSAPTPKARQRVEATAAKQARAIFGRAG